ncbi:MAG: peptidoglycan DD-metalloendopeptidase family protein [Thiomargarita sp.]|nr:peptidoglycan DD-metalloendopeptidase family protein [Thiomargarita sp.]
MRYIWLILAFLLFGLIAASADESVKESTTEQLRQLELRISELQQEMHDTKTQYGQRQQQLQHIEENIGEVAQNLEILYGAFTNKQISLTSLKTRQQKLQSQLDIRRKILAQQFHEAYVIKHQDYLKLWLNQEQPSTISRLLTYYQYSNRAKLKQIKKIKTTLQRLTTLEQSIKLESIDLNQLVYNHNHRKKDLELAYNKRHTILIQLASTLKNQDKELKHLAEDKQKLQKLLTTLEDTLKTSPDKTQEYTQLSELKGKLPLPVTGKIIKKFGQRLVNHLKWQGILISAPQGRKIQAIAAGRVVFAQWFRNLGLLVIIDHGNKYMSLYAHNQSLYVKNGDWVNANMSIATVGSSGGQKIPALYFEIRYQGIPQAPQNWLRL